MNASYPERITKKSHREAQSLFHWRRSDKYGSRALVSPYGNGNGWMTSCQSLPNSQYGFQPFWRVFKQEKDTRATRSPMMCQEGVEKATWWFLGVRNPSLDLTSVISFVFAGDSAFLALANDPYAVYFVLGFFFGANPNISN